MYHELLNFFLSEKTNNLIEKWEKYINSDERNENGGNSLAVQWFRLCALTAKGPCSIPGQGTKIPQAMRFSHKKEKEKWPLNMEICSLNSK